LFIFSNIVIIADFVSVFHSHILSALYLQTKLTDFDIEVIDLCHCKPLWTKLLHPFNGLFPGQPG